MDVSDCRGPQAAMEFLEKKLAEASDRSGEFAYAWLAHGCAMQLAKDRKSREKATLYYQKTVDSMRKFRDKYRQLTSAEQNLLQVALYNEACLLATSGQPEKALAVLREALKAGFRDLPHILSDEDLRSVRDLPAFDALLKEQDERR
jgi:tetratricopeptide (TPR) repeat protein